MPSNLVLKLPDELVSRFRSMVPNRQRTRVIASLIDGIDEYVPAHDEKR